MDSEARLWPLLRGFESRRLPQTVMIQQTQIGARMKQEPAYRTFTKAWNKLSIESRKEIMEKYQASIIGQAKVKDLK